MVVGVAEGAISLEDIDGFIAEIFKANAVRYRKIVDIMAATPNLAEKDVFEYGERSKKAPPDARSGPIAIVASDAQGPLARLFAQFTYDRRPTKVFRSIHEARKWLMENTRRE